MNRRFLSIMPFSGVATLAAMTAALSLTTAGCGGGGSHISTPLNNAPFTFTTFDGAGDHTGGTVVNGISNTGSAVGVSINAGGQTFTNFVRSPDGSLDPLNITDTAAQASGINSSGTVVGFSGTNAFVFQGGTETVLPSAKSGSTSSELALGINDGGIIVGQYTDSSTGKTPGFAYANGTFTTLNPTADAMVTNAQGVNNNGLVIGFYSTDGMHQHGFTYNLRTQKITLLPDPSTPRTANNNLFLTQFLGVNDHNQAVGYYQTNNGSQFGFLFDLNTNTYTYLDAPGAAPVNGVQITQITGITNAGEISGFFIDSAGVQHGFVAAH